MKEIIQSLIEFRKAVDPIYKGSRAQYGKYADLQTVLQTITPVLSEHGLFLSQSFDCSVLQTTLYHLSGESISSACKLIVADGRNPLHTWGAAVTYQRRYAVLSLLGLATEDDDGDSIEHRTTKPKQDDNSDFL